MDKVSWGFIGCGDVTEVKSGPAFNKIKDSSVVAVMRRNAEKAKDYAYRHNVPKWYDDVDKLINDPDVNAVYIATPPDVHLEYTVKCAQAGKAVYVEKPMALNYAQAQQMVEVCKKTDTPLFAALYRRRLPRFLKVKELIDSGVIGKVRAVNLSLYFSPNQEDYDRENLPWRVLPDIAGGGYFFDLAPHQLDILDYILGPIAQAKGFANNQAALYPAEDIVTAVYRFESGALGTGIWCFSASPEERIDRIEIIGSKGNIRLACFETTPVELVVNNEKQYFPEPTPQHVQQPLIETVVDDLLGRGKCPSTGESALRTARVMEQILFGS